ncbi:hypothetical protein DFH07DRAFT_1059997 [Mycena maculata]|uniref:Prolyl 4-hydroxylase alpha subunit Fe(2+) 2OG dioxygenase domain-containing protein n=1 Tax=Mycena maculata TaxID=230809 RepID=A0AAD7NG16_9AGAR|nr:hypothetical protein DFH07DRAFT_1059997 [Mycena maculata]
MSDSIAKQLKVLQQSLEAQVPYTGGVHLVKADDLVVYYDIEGERPRRIDLGNATEGDLAHLAAACQKATFGVDQADVLDETYRKAGKMDPSKLATRLDIVTSGILAAIRPDILQGQNVDTAKVLTAELYKLNVYGTGSFFKAHKDTPRGETMIGSLVVVFPTAHTGGALTLEHGGKSWTFDSAAELSSSAATPALAYVAFYSDVTHAVQPVRTGHRVTLTYNLFLTDEATQSVSAALRIVPGPGRAFEDALRALLADAAFLPTGGFLAYGLAHQYPVPSAPPPDDWVDGMRTRAPSRLGPLLQLLKGSDARIRTVSENVGLATAVKMLYNTGENSKYGRPGCDVLADDVLNTDHVYAEGDDELEDAIEQEGTILAREEERARELNEAAIEKMKRSYGDYYDTALREIESARQQKPPKETVPVHWVTKITALNRVGSHYIAYGNEASLGHVYGNAALFVRVPAFGDGVRAV